MAEEAVVTHFGISRSFPEVHKVLQYFRPRGLNSNKGPLEYEEEILTSFRYLFLELTNSVQKRCISILLLFCGC